MTGISAMKWVHHTIIMSAILGFFIWLAWAPPSSQRGVYFPWQITLLEGGDSQVFGLTLGKSTLADVIKLHQDHSVAIFYKPGNALRLEAYLPNFKSGPLIAKLIAEIDVDNSLLEKTYETYEVHRKPIDDQGFKVELSSSSIPELLTAKIISLSYSPKANLDEALLLKHFGTPDSKIAESDNISHWLYPKKGLSIAYSLKGKELFQYLPPKNFDRMIKKLEINNP
ncbi:MAG: hypothetical protein HOM11_12755 [Methylococcales bacterium]|nr:hypothetical protein [Methylococcales bacterium]MBT7445329.1 hypothetical protein [Methylococcales bacterium]